MELDRSGSVKVCGFIADRVFLAGDCVRSGTDGAVCSGDVRELVPGGWEDPKFTSQGAQEHCRRGTPSPPLGDTLGTPG